MLTFANFYLKKVVFIVFICYLTTLITIVVNPKFACLLDLSFKVIFGKHKSFKARITGFLILKITIIIVFHRILLYNLIKKQNLL